MRKCLTISFLTCAVTVLLLFTAEISYAALEMEYYTYGSFDAVLSAFQKAALVFSDKNYMGLMFTVITLGIFFAATGSMISALKGMKTGGFSWAVPVGIGVTLFLAMVIPKGTIWIYDPVKNRSQAVGDVPEGLVLLAGTTNLIERGLVDVISTSTDPIGYQQQAGGIGFDMLNNVHSKGINLGDQYIHDSLRSYTEDCVFFELLRTGTQLSANTINKNSDFIGLYQQAENPAVFTVYYKDEDDWRAGKTKTCTEAYALLVTDLKDTAKYTNVTKARCGEIGFDPTNPAEFQQCKDMFANLASWFEGAAWEQVNFFKQVLIAQTFSDAIIAASPDTSLAIMMSRNAGTSMMATGAMANSWIPTIRGILVSVAIMLTPFLVIFLPTPLYGKALGLICGLFIWPMSWGIIDAALHQFAMDFSYKAMEEVRQNELGLLAVSSFGTSSLKALAMFGTIRWAGLMLSTVITGMMIKFGGQALAMMAGSLTSPVQGAAAKAGMDTQTPEGRTALDKNLISAHGWHSTIRPNFSTTELANAGAVKQAGDIQGTTDMINAFDMEGAVRKIADQKIGFTLDKAAGGKAARDTGLKQASKIKETVAKTNLLGDEKAIGRMDGDENFIREASDTIAKEKQKKINSMKDVDVPVTNPLGSYNNMKNGKVKDVRFSNLNTGIGVSQRDSLVRSAAKDLSNNKTVREALLSGKELSKSFKVDKGFSKTVSNTLNQETAKNLSSNMSFGKSMSEEKRKDFIRAIKVGAAFKGNGVDGRLQWMWTSKDGKTFKEDLSLNDAQSIKDARNQAITDTFSKVESTSQNLKNLQQISGEVGAVESYKSLTQAQTEDSASRKLNIDTAPELLEYVRKTYFGDQKREEGRESALKKVAEWRTEDPAKLVEVQKTVTDNIYDRLKPSDFVTPDVNTMKERGVILQEKWENLTDEIKSNTDGITSDSLKPPPPKAKGINRAEKNKGTADIVHKILNEGKGSRPIIESEKK